MLTDNLAKLNRTSRNSIFAALIVIAALAMYNWIAAPHVAYLFAAQELDFAVGKIVEKNKSVARELEAREKKLEDLSEQYARCQDILFTPEEAKKFFGDLQTILEETGCTVNSLNLVVSKSRSANKKPEGTSGMVANSARLSVIGQYSSIIGLVEKLQNHTQKVWVDSFKMEIFDFSSALLKCDMTITIYTIRGKEAIL